MNKSTIKHYFKTTIFGMLIALIILTVLFALFSVIVLYSNISPTLITQISTILGAFSLFLSTFIVTKIIKKNGIFIGLIFGVITSLIIVLITYSTTGVVFSIGNVTKALIITLASCLGGVLGVNSKE